MYGGGSSSPVSGSSSPSRMKVTKCIESLSEPALATPNWSSMSLSIVLANQPLSISSTSRSAKTRSHSCFHSPSSSTSLLSTSPTSHMKTPWKTRERSRRLKM